MARIARAVQALEMSTFVMIMRAELFCELVGPHMVLGKTTIMSFYLLVLTKPSSEAVC